MLVIRRFVWLMLMSLRKVGELVKVNGLVCFGLLK